MKTPALCLGFAALILVAACATDETLTQSRDLLNQGRGDEALAMLERASREHPENRAYRAAYFRERDRLFEQWLAQADSLQIANALEPAEKLYRQVLRYDPVHARATLGLNRIETEKRHRVLIAKADALLKENKTGEAQALLAEVLNENPGQREALRLRRLIDEKTAASALAAPQLKSAITKPFSIELRDVDLRTVFEVLSRTTKLTFLFDRDVDAGRRTTIIVRDAPLEDVIRLILTTNQLEYQVVNETTAIIFPNTQQKLREYQELVVKSFYISNADVRQTANMLRTILKTRDVFVDEKLNLLVLKDTPNNIRYAERLIAAQDVAEPEVMLEVEVLEIDHNRLLNLGLQYPSTLAWSLVGGSGTTTTNPTTGATTATAGTPGVLTLSQWLSRNSSLVQLTFSDPLFLLSLQQQDGSTNLLANPRIRVKNREKAVIHIGDRLPVITTTAAASGSFVSQSVSYLDVGLKLEVEPVIYLDDDVGIKLGLEVSSITNTIQSPTGGTLTYQIGTRTANTVLRMRDGETQILGGLINDQDQRSANRVPGLGDLPVLGRLFSSTNQNNTKSEVTLLITPHIIRGLRRPDARITEFSAGTEPPPGTSSLGGPIAPAQPFIPPPAPTPTTPPAAQTTPAQPQGNTMAPFGGMQAPQR
ncbi:MAG TPA: secretin N-terminal domain-containing protein [Burkholderiales bacterium]|nr:secretin N-terminal domain-containing protein [Burkholderiales bacterium]